MPFRTRIKRAFSRRSTDDHSTKKNSKTAKVESNIYQPGEKMPPLKYRRPVAPEHKAMLESFDWAKAWRRKSPPSVYSPMGSRMPSRKTSYSTLGRRSIGGRSARSVGRKSSLRSEGVVGVDSGFGGSVDESRPEGLREGSDEEGDVLNVGLSLSRHTTLDPRRKSSSAHGRRSASMHRRSQSIRSGSSLPPPVGNERARSKIDTQFAPEDLELALRRSHLEASKKEEGGLSGQGSSGDASFGRAVRTREIQFVD